MRTTFIALLGAALVGCAALANLRIVPPNQRYNAMCASWMHDNVSQVIVAWGPPTIVSPLPDGTTLYEWDEVDGADVPLERIGHFSRAQERGAAWCSTRFVTSGAGEITAYKWNGNDYNDGVNFRTGCYTNYMPPAPQTTAMMQPR